jgi:signal transduction histidine kinase
MNRICFLIALFIVISSKLAMGQDIGIVLKKNIEQLRKYSYSDSGSLFRLGNESILLAKKNTIATHEADVLILFGNYFFYQYDLKIAVDYYNKALSISKNLKYNHAYNIATIRLGYVELEKGIWLAPEKKFLKILEKSKNEKDTIAIIESYNGLAHLNLLKNYKDKAITYYNLAIPIAKNAKKEYYYAFLLNNLGLVLLDLKQETIAKNNFIQALAISEKIQNERLTNHLTNNIGNYYSDKNSLDTALFYYQKFLINSKKGNSKANMAAAYLNIAAVKIKLKDYVNANVYIDSSIIISVNNNILEIVPRGYITKAQILYDLKDYSKAEKYAVMALKEAYKINSIKDIGESYRLKSEINEQTNKLNQALADFKKYKLYNDSLNDLEATKRIAEIQSQYELEEKEKQLITQKNKLIILEKENAIRKERWIIGIVSVVIISALVLVLIVLRGLYLSKKQKELFAIKLLNNIEEERNRIAKDLHDDIGASLSMIKNKLYTKIENKEVFEDLERDISKVIDNTRTISHQLYPAYIKKVGFKIALNELCRYVETENNIKVFLSMNNVEFARDVAFETHIFRVLQECVANTIKHSKATAIKINLTQLSSQLTIIYQDNGIGFNPSENNFGIGLMTIQERIRSLNGKFRIDSSENKNTRFIFNLSINN